MILKIYLSIITHKGADLTVNWQISFLLKIQIGVPDMIFLRPCVRHQTIKGTEILFISRRHN